LLLKGSEFSTVSFYGVHLLTTTGISTGQFVFIGGTGRFQQAQGSANYTVNQDSIQELLTLLLKVASIISSSDYP
jgi:hypothetical protein